MNICFLFVFIFLTLELLEINFSILCDEVVLRLWDRNRIHGYKNKISNAAETTDRIRIPEARYKSVEFESNQQWSINEPLRPWISEMFDEAEKQFTIHPDASDQCRKSFDTYKVHLKNNSLWAVRMHESSQWPRQGLLVGTTPFLGHYDTCITVNADSIKGKHCFVESTFDFPEPDTPITPAHSLATPSQNSSVWLALQMHKSDIHRIRQNKIWWTLCIPSSCSSVDLNKSLERTLRNVFAKYSINTTTNLMEDRCHTSHIELDTQYYYVKYFIGLLGFVVIFSSIIVARNDGTDQGTCSSVLKCFSIQKNYHKLMDVTPKREFMLIHVYKIFCITALVVLHRLAYMIRHVHHDTNAIERMVYTLNYFFIYGPEITDLMFFFSGVLMHKDFVKSSTNEISEIAMKIVKRWLRLFPTYVIIRLFYAHILPVLNGGPLWHEMLDDAAYCKTNLLPALLTLPSARNEKMCLPPSWQMAVDFQLFSIGYLSLCLCRRYKMDEIKVLFCLIGVSSILTFCNIFYHKYTSILFLNLRNYNVDRNAENKEIFHSSYLSAVARLAPYSIGILVAATVHKMKERRYTLSRAQKIYGFVAVVGIQSVIVVSGQGLYSLRDTNEYRRTWHAIHGAFLHSLANIVVVFTFFVYFVNGFEYLERKIPRIVVPLSRLSHVVSLSHFIVILPHIFSQRVLVSFTNACSLIHLLVADVLLSYTLAFFIYLMVDGPIQNLLFIWRHNTRKNETREFQNKNETLKKGD